MAIPVPFPYPRVLRVIPAARAAVVHDAVLLAGIMGAALWVRWPHLLTMPAFASVDLGIRSAIAVAEGGTWPLSDQAPYLGAIFIYLLAGVYRIFGVSLENTMLLTWLLGGLTIIPTYLLGRELGGRMAGVIASALLIKPRQSLVYTYRHYRWKIGIVRAPENVSVERKVSSPRSCPLRHASARLPPTTGRNSSFTSIGPSKLTMS